MQFIDLDRVSRWYGKQQALRDVTLHLQPGRIGLLGPNGAGKSTLLKILLGLLPPSSGTVCVLVQELRGTRSTPDYSVRLTDRFVSTLQEMGSNGEDLRRGIGYMPEADALIPGLHGAEYVALAGELYGMP